MADVDMEKIRRVHWARGAWSKRTTVGGLGGPSSFGLDEGVGRPLVQSSSIIPQKIVLEG